MWLSLLMQNGYRLFDCDFFLTQAGGNWPKCGVSAVSQRDDSVKGGFWSQITLKEALRLFVLLYHSAFHPYVR